MKVFGGLINCVRTFGNQIIAGTKTFLKPVIVQANYALPVSLNKAYHAIDIHDENDLTLTSLLQYTTATGSVQWWVRAFDYTNASNYVDFRVLANPTHGVVSFNPHGLTNDNLGLIPPNVNNVNVALFGTVYDTMSNKSCLYPNYANAVDLDKSDGTIADNGWILMYCTTATNLSINGFSIPLGYGVTEGGTLLLPVKAGDTYASTSWATMGQFKFIPNRW